MFKTTSFNIPLLVDWGTDALLTVEEANEVEEFFKANPTPIAERSVKQAVIAVKNTAAIRARDSAAVAAALSTSQ
jgi:puromycin-sensitive aminopeptidase